MTRFSPNPVVILSPWRKICAKGDDAMAQPDPSVDLALSFVEWVKMTTWVWLHQGIMCSFNVEPELAHFDGIVPCGIRGHGVTSLVDLGLPVTMADLDAGLRRAAPAALAPFGVTADRLAPAVRGPLR